MPADACAENGAMARRVAIALGSGGARGYAHIGVLNELRDRGYEVIERAIMPDELGKAAEVFLTGTAAEVTPVGEIGPYKFTVGDVTRTQMEDYERAVGKTPASKASAA